MKAPNAFFLMSLFALSAAPSAWSASPDTVQLAVSRAFVPPTGYDDNDNVVVRAEGTLPDACYVLGAAQVSKSPDGKTFEIQESAWRREDGACGTGDLLTATTYSVDVALGSLSAGTYRIKQVADDGSVTYNTFTVVPARSSSVDDHNYANVTQILVADYVQRGQDVAVTLSGIYSSSCTALQSPMGIHQEGDVFVVKPIEVQVPGKSCNLKILRMFRKNIHLGAVAPGEYLVHVRARNGRAVEQTFTVIDPQDPALR